MMTDSTGIVAIVGAVSGVGGLVMAAFTIWHGARQSRAMETILKQFAKVTMSYEREVAALRRSFEKLPAAASSAIELAAAKLALEREKEERRRRKDEWERGVATARAIGWILDNSEED